jgi:hypothetical protein
LKEIARKYNKLDNTVDFSGQLLENSHYKKVTKEFQKSTIYCHAIEDKAVEAVYVYEDQYENWTKIGVESNLGYPLNDQITDYHGFLILFFEYGCMVGGKGIPEPIICRYFFPKIGNPGIVNPDRSYETNNFIRCMFDPIKKSVYDHMMERNPHFFEEIFRNNFFLRSVSSKSLDNDILLFPEINVGTVSPLGINEKEVIISISFGPNPSASLHDKTLFDIVFEFVNDFTLAPHALYANRSWDNFVIMHITDIHVSIRLEYAKDDLKKMSKTKPDLINEYNIIYFNNFNDNFRDFISYVNSLYKNGSVDCILATGDLIDYIYDSGNHTAKTPRNPSNIDRVNGNNFDFFKRLILGLEPGRDGTKNEELLVPIFTSLGNHDYRDMPYCWIGEVDITGVKNPNITNFPNTNLSWSEAKALEGDEKPLFSKDNAVKMAHVDTNLPQYNTINERRSYIINLGPHRIVMLDSAEDIGIIDTSWDGFLHFMGWDSDDAQRFSEASPNCKGIQQKHIQLVKQALAEAGSNGIVIVGIHAPLMDQGNYPYYLRETDRLTANENVMKRGFPYFSPFFSFIDGYNGNGKKEGWPMTGTSYFKFGGVDFTLANGVSKGLNQEFLEICAGVGLSRKVDLVLSGHGHHNVEFRLEFEPNKKILFFHDFYTENPLRYYAMKLLSETDYKNFKLALGASDYPQFTFEEYRSKMKPYFIVPREGVSIPRFIQVTDRRTDPPFIENRIEVKPYPTPLNKTNDKMGWWTKHRPLFVQTVALGPLETFNNNAKNPASRLSDVSFFHGCRKITIKNNVISSIETVHMSDIRGDRPRLCSFKELCKVRGVSLPASIRTLAEDISFITPIGHRLKIFR